MSNTKKIFGLFATGAAYCFTGNLPALGSLVTKKFMGSMVEELGPNFAHQFLSEIDYADFFKKYRDISQLNHHLDGLIHKAAVDAIRNLRTLYLQKLESEIIISKWDRIFSPNAIKEAERVLEEMERDWQKWSKDELIEKTFLDDPSQLFKEITSYVFTVSSANRDTEAWQQLTAFFEAHLPACFELAYKDLITDEKYTAAFKSLVVENFRGLNSKLDQVLSLLEKNACITRYKKLLSTVNPSAPVDFIGRITELERLHQQLQTGNRVVLVNGMGGIGKTALAKTFAWQHQNEYDHIVMINLLVQDDVALTPEQCMAKLVEAFALDNLLATNLGLQFSSDVTDEQKFETIINALKNLPAREQGKSLLLVDNLPDMPHNLPLHEILPGPPHWHCLVTSRHLLQGFDVYKLETLGLPEAKQLFTTLYTGACNEATLDLLMEEIGCHTLTTELLAKTLQQKEAMMTLEAFTAAIQSRKLDDAALQEKITTAHHNSGETTVYLHLAKALSMVAITPAERKLMVNFAFLLPGSYTAIALAEWLNLEEEEDKKELRETLRQLWQKGWLSKKEDGYSMHRMVQQLVHYQLDPGWEDIEALRSKITKKLNDRTTTDYRVVFNTILYGEWFLAALPQRITEDFRRAILIGNLGTAYFNKGEFDKAIEHFNKALDIAFMLYGEEHFSIDAWYNNLGNAYDSKGEHGKAIKYYHKAMDIAKRLYGEDHSSFAIRYGNLGGAYCNIGEYDKAIQYFQDAIVISNRFYGGDDPNIATWFNNLGGVYASKGWYDNAIEYYKKALAIGKKFYGEDDPRLATWFKNLGGVYNSKGWYDNAIEYFKESLVIATRYFGEDHPDIAGLYNNFGNAYYLKRDYDKAIEYYKKALVISWRYYGEDHPHMVTRYNNLGKVYESKGEHNKAIEYYKKALEINRKFYGEDHPSVTILYNNLGGAYDRKSHHRKAIQYFYKALIVGRKFYGEDHPDIATTYNNLGLAYKSLGEYGKAIEYHEKSIAIGGKFYGEHHPNIATQCGNLGIAYNRNGEYDKAIEYFDRAVAIGKIIYGEYHPDMATCYNNLGNSYAYKGNIGKAIEYYEKAIAISREFYGGDHPDMTTKYSNLGMAYNSNGEPEKANECFEKSLAIGRKFYGEDHPDIAICCNNLGVYYEGKGDHNAAILYFEKALSIGRKFYDEDYPFITELKSRLENG